MLDSFSPARVIHELSGLLPNGQVGAWQNRQGDAEIGISLQRAGSSSLFHSLMGICSCASNYGAIACNKNDICGLGIVSVNYLWDRLDRRRYYRWSSYDNIRIVLHRPFVRYIRCLLFSSSWRNSDAGPTSFEQCKHYDGRTSGILPRYSKILLAAQSAHAAAYIAIQSLHRDSHFGHGGSIRPGLRTMLGC